MIDIKHLTSATAEKGDSQGKIISFGLRGIPKNTEISFGKIHDYQYLSIKKIRVHYPSIVTTKLKSYFINTKNNKFLKHIL